MKANARPHSRAMAALGIDGVAGTQHSVHCPAHDDNNASLSVGVKPDGTIGVHCHAGCTPEAVCAALGLTLADLFAGVANPRRQMAARPRRAAKPGAEAPAIPDDERAAAHDAAKRLGPASLTGYRLTAVYCYRDANGKTWGWRARYENSAGEKQIKPFHRSVEGWVMREAPSPRKGKPLYRLPEALAADGPVYVVEGEKCADALAGLGIAATTSGAARSASKADWSPLSGRRCVIWPDNDNPGEQYAADVAEAVAANGCDVAIVDIDALRLSNEGADAADWLAANPGATAADVLALPTTQPAETGVQLVRASDIAEKAVNWLWPGYLAGGMLTLIAGNGGTGKTTIALSIAATITKGGKLPDGATAPLGSVIIWSGEDALAEVLVPRLREAGADDSRVHFVAGDQSFDPATGLPALERAALRIDDLALVIIDPIVSAVQGDSHKNAEVRRGLQPLLNLAADTGAAVIGITHYAKNTAGRSTTDRVIGSVAFNAVARVTLATAMGAFGEGRMVRAKNNVGITGDGFAYSIAIVHREVGGQTSQVSKIEWGKALYGSADELLGQIEEKRLPKDEAAEWLTAALLAGPLASKELKAKAEADGIAWRTVERAKEALGIVALRHTAPGQSRGKGEWSWKLPPSKHHR